MKIKSEILGREIDPQAPEVVVEICESLARSVAAGRKQIQDDNAEVKAGLKTAQEAAEAAQRAVADIEVQMAAANRKVHGFPEFDPADLGWDGSSAAFHRALQSRPTGAPAVVRLMTDLQQAADDFFIVRTLMELKRKRALTIGEMANLRTFKRFDGLKAKLVRALDSSTTGEGLEWIPTDFSSQIMEKVALQLRIGSLFQTYQMPSNPWNFPFEAALPDTQRVAQQTTTPTNAYTTTGVTEMYTAGTPTSQKVFSLKKHRATLIVSYEMEEDSIIAAMPFLRNRIPYAIARGREKMILNGDTAATHLDNDVTGQGSSGTAPETVLDGLRDFYLAQTTSAATVDAGGAQPTSAHYRSLKAKMGEFGVDPSVLAWIVGAWGSAALLQNPDLRTVDKLGIDRATIRFGQIGEFDGSPVILSGMVKENLSSSGKNDSGGTNDMTATYLVNTLNFGIAEKGTRPVEEERWLLTDQRLLVLFDRLDFGYIGATTDKAIGAIHSIPLALTN